MDKKKYKLQSIYYLIGLAVLGIMLFSIIMRLINLGNYHAAGVPAVVVWLMFYVNYANLKTKVEILEGVKKEKSDKSTREN
jgi:hypothetical protein